MMIWSALHGDMQLTQGQQIPSRGEIGDEARKLFIARPGYKLVVADYSNMEMVVAAHYSNDEKLSSAFSQGLDVHGMTAAGQHNLDYDTFMRSYKTGSPEADMQRRVAKTTNFGSMYSIGAKKFQRMLLVQNGQEFSLDETHDLLRSFNSTYSGLTEWKQKVSAYVREYGYIVTLGGRFRRLPKAFSRDPYERSRAERQAVNATIQGSCSDILFRAMIVIQATFKALGGSLIASVHDELIAEIPEDKADIAARLMGELMVAEANQILRVKLSAEAHVGDSWYDAKKG